MLKLPVPTPAWPCQARRGMRNRITRQDLRLYPYQMIRRHELSPADYARRLAFCNWFLERPPRFLESLVIGDEACFCMNSSLNAHNILQYAPRGEKPVEFSFEKNDCWQKLTVWIGMIGDGTLLGPLNFFFQPNINGERYLQMINDQIVWVLDERERFRRQQNGRFMHNVVGSRRRSSTQRERCDVG